MTVMQRLLRPDERLSRWLGLAAVAMPFIVLLPKYFVIQTIYQPDDSIFDLGFGIAGYVRSLFETGDYRSCTDLPFLPCHLGVCTSADRMPVVPLIVAGLGKLVGTSSANVAMARSVLMASIQAVFLRLLTRDCRFSLTGLLVLFGLCFGPQTVKHGATLDYEEGLLVDLSLCYAIAASYLVFPGLTTSAPRRTAMAIAAVAISSVMYFTKTSALLTTLVTLALLISSTHMRLRWKSLGVLIFVGPLSLWAIHTTRHSGELHLSSSWNGENLFAGFNPGAVDLFPQISLDRVFDSDSARLDNGRVVPLGNYRKQICFDDEWSWDRYYARRAREWVGDHPREAATLIARKVWVTLGEVRHVPQRHSATQNDVVYPPAVSAAMLAWMVFARSIFVALVIWMALQLKRRNWRVLWLAGIVGATCAPYMLVLVWQRHMVPILVMVGVFLVVLAARPARAECSNRILT